MKALCGISGIQFQIEHFPAYIDSRDVCHPIFYLPQRKLLSYITKWSNAELTPTDSYLLFLALLNSTGAMEWRVPVRRIKETDGIIANNMEDLAICIGKINTITHPSFHVPHIAISSDSCTLSSVEFWIANWEVSIDDWRDSYASYNEAKDLRNREYAIEKLIRTPHKEIQLATQLADWAEIAGDFPQSLTLVNGANITIAHYWKQIIRKCINKESIFAVPIADIDELIEHCETNIPHGSIYAHTLMQMLRNGRDKNKNFLGLGDWDTASSQITFQILSDSDSVESANISALLNTAPTSTPSLTDYPSRFAWLKAKMKYELSLQITAQNAGETK